MYKNEKEWTLEDVDYECAWCYKPFKEWQGLLNHLVEAFHTKESAMEALNQMFLWKIKQAGIILPNAFRENNK